MKLESRLDISHAFFDKFNTQNTKARKKVGLYEFEAIDNPIMVFINVNTKEYFEKYWNKSGTKKHKGFRKDSPEITFESFASCIL